MITGLQHFEIIYANEIYSIQGGQAILEIGQTTAMSRLFDLDVEQQERN